MPNKNHAWQFYFNLFLCRSETQCICMSLCACYRFFSKPLMTQSCTWDFFRCHHSYTLHFSNFIKWHVIKDAVYRFLSLFLRKLAPDKIRIWASFLRSNSILYNNLIKVINPIIIMTHFLRWACLLAFVETL